MIWYGRWRRDPLLQTSIQVNDIHNSTCTENVTCDMEVNNWSKHAMLSMMIIGLRYAISKQQEFNTTSVTTSHTRQILQATAQA